MYQKMNFSPFAPQFSSALQANQFATAKFTQNLGATTNGQVLGLVSTGTDGEIHYLNASGGQTQVSAASANAQPALITLPITMPGAKPGDAQQTVQIQVVNPNSLHQGGSGGLQLQQPQQHQPTLPIQNFQQGTTVLTVAYAPQDGDLLHNHGLPEGMTVVAALQPQDLQLIAQAQAQQLLQQHSNDDNNDKELLKSIKQEPPDQGTTISNPSAQIQWQNTAVDLSEYLSRFQQQQQQQQNQSSQQHELQLNQFLKFNVDGVKREPESDNGAVGNASINGVVINCDYAQLLAQQHLQLHQQQSQQNTPDNNNNNAIKGTIGSAEQQKIKKKRRYKKKPAKPKRPKPGQVHIATALDGTVLFCCPECHRAYPEKENLEQHLSTHKIERRFICDICGAGLKRKEHLERHKLGHNPDRPYICSVCMKGFKRKEHLNLHFVIHSGQKTEICVECGKGFYRKDHLRKHAKSHALKRQKEINAHTTENVLATSAVNPKGDCSGTKSEKAGPKAKSKKGVTNAAAVATSNSNNNGCKTQESTTSIQIYEIPLSTIATTSGGMQTTTTTVTASVNIPKSSSVEQQSLINHNSIPPNTTILHIPTGDNTTLPVQIQLPEL